MLFYSEVHQLVAIQDNADANSSELAKIQSITNGAVTQIADKLVLKGLIVRFKQRGNRKETYYRLTEKGKRVYKRHKAHHDRMQSEVKEYLGALDNSKTKVVSTFLDKVICGFSPK